jgi:hypothetical protein
MAVTLGDGVRAHGAHIAAHARSVRIDLEALEGLEPGPPPELDAQRHYLEGLDADVADYLLVLDAINFGSGWFPTLRKRTGSSGYFTVAWALADRWRAGAGWSPVQLRTMRTEEVADTLGQARDHELMALYAETLATAMTMWHDDGFYKRAQIAGSDLALGGVAQFADLDALTIFADNLVPHVLRCEGVLAYDERLAAHIDAGRLLRAGPQEREIRGCAVHACALIAQRTGMTERDIDNALWYRGQRPEYKARPRHRCRTVYY